MRIRRWQTARGEVLRISETRLDCERQLAEVQFSVYEHGNDGTFSTFRETQLNRYFLAQEMGYWLSSTGFAPLGFFDGYSVAGRVTEGTWHIVAVARRENGNG